MHAVLTEMPRSPHRSNSHAVSPLQQMTAVDRGGTASTSKGVHVQKDELENAFSFLDVERNGTISLNILRKSLSVFFPDISLRDLKFLMNNNKDLSIADLWDLLENNKINNFDPVAEAYAIYDSEGRGSLDGGKLSSMFVSFGLGEISPHEMELLHRTADMDGDGAVSLQDFRSLLESTKNHSNRRSATRKAEVEEGGAGAQNTPHIEEYTGNSGHD